MKGLWDEVHKDSGVGEVVGIKDCGENGWDSTGELWKESQVKTARVNASLERNPSRAPMKGLGSRNC